jgi:hypothetical protein
MKNLFLVFFLWFSATNCFAQMHDNIWIVGYTANGVVDPDFGVFTFKHSEKPIRFTKIASANLRSNAYSAFFADSLGEKILFWTNGVSIFNGQHKIMENGDNLNPDFNGNNSDNFRYEINGQLSGAIPDPGHPDYAYLIHTGINVDPIISPVKHLLTHLYYSKIDLRANNGLGKVIEKNIALTTGDFTKLAIVKHGDGKSYWVVIGQRSEAGFLVFHFDSTGIKGPMLQGFNGFAFSSNNDFDRLLFTPNGEELIRVGTYGGIVRYSFDRCSGKISNTRIFPYQHSQKVQDASVSADSKYLFFNTSTNLMRLDLSVLSLPLSRTLDTIARFNFGKERGVVYRFFYLHSLSPTGDIIMAPFNTVRAFHVIHTPETPILSHDFEQGAIPLPAYNSASLPMYINYRLGPKLGSICAPMALAPFDPSKPTVLPVIHNGVFRAPPSDLQFKMINNLESLDHLTIPDPNTFYHYEK